MNLNIEPKIRVNGLSSVAVDPVATIDDLAVITRKFGRLVDADLAFAALKLTTATGDLVASVSDGDTAEATLTLLALLTTLALLTLHVRPGTADEGEREHVGDVREERGHRQSHEATVS